MRKKMIQFIIGAMVLPGAILIHTYSTQASTSADPSVDLAITGTTVAGFTSAQDYQELPVTFTMTNHSKTTTTEVSFEFTMTNASTSVGVSDFVCPEIPDHFNINPDGGDCEIGRLAHGKSTSAAAIVTPTISTGTVTVTACAESLDGYTDPVPRNNCKTISIPIK